MKYNNKINLQRGLLATAIMVASVPVTQAFEFDTGSQDWAIRFDNTLKLNYGQRVESPNSKLANTWNSNDGDRHFSSGSPVSQRIDVLSELDVVYQEQMGFRVSANSWYDHAYDNVDAYNPSPNRINNGTPTSSGLNGYADRYYNGPSSEILDAFVFGSTEVGDASVLGGKLGKTTSYWGESLFSVAHGVAYGQAGVDIAKQLSIPGTEAKELFIPREQMQATFNLNEEWSFSGQYFLDWNAARLPESGTYLGFNDGLQNGGHGLSLIGQANPLAARGPGFTPLRQIPAGPLAGKWVGIDFGAAGAPDYLHAFNGKTYEPDDRGDFGLMSKWSPEWLDGSLGFYYRNTSDILPNVVIVPGQDAVPGSLPITACNDPAGASCLGVIGTAGNLGLPLPNALVSGNIGNYHQFYADDINIFGLSLSKSLGDASVGVDLNYRENMPLNSVAATVNPGLAGRPGFIAGFSGDSDEAVAKGKTVHLVVNSVIAFADTPVWDSSNLTTELAYSRWLSVDKNEHLFKGEDWYHGIDKVTKDNYVLGVNFTPTWYQVLPGMDMYLPLNYSVGLDGQSSVGSGGNEDAGSYSVGVAADLYSKYRFDLKYVDNFGPFDTCESGTDGAAPGAANNYACTPGQATSFAGVPSQLKDRGMVTFTFKTTI